MVSLNDNDKSANDFHPLVVRIMYFGVLFYIYNLIFNDMMDYIREKDVSNIWDMATDIIYICSFVLILTKKKIGLFVYAFTEVILLIKNCYTKTEQDLNTYILFFVSINILLCILFSMKKDKKSAWQILFS